MDMTTPVYTTAGQGGTAKMQFPVEERQGEDPNRLPIPTDSRWSADRDMLTLGY